MRRPLVLVAVAVLLPAGLAACGDDEGSAAGFCDQAESFSESDPFDSLDPEDPNQLDEALGLLEDFRDAAPGEVEEDLTAVVDFFEAYAAAIGEAGDDPEAQAEALSGLEDEFGEIETNLADVETFVTEECDVDLGS